MREQRLVQGTQEGLEGVDRRVVSARPFPEHGAEGQFMAFIVLDAADDLARLTGEFDRKPDFADMVELNFTDAFAALVEAFDGALGETENSGPRTGMATVPVLG